jgi:hypothetical protein
MLYCRVFSDPMRTEINIEPVGFLAYFDVVRVTNLARGKRRALRLVVLYTY